MKWTALLLVGCQLVQNGPGIGAVEPMEWEEFQSIYPTAWCERRFNCLPFSDRPGYETVEDCVEEQLQIAVDFYEGGCTYDGVSAAQCAEETSTDAVTCEESLTSACFAWCVDL